MDQEDAVDSTSRLHRQERAAQRTADGRRLVPSRVPETRPPLLGDWFIYLSIVVLVCGVVAITALELGARAGDAVVRLPVVIGGLLVVVLAADAALRVWRSAWAWLPIDRGRGLFRFVWAGVLAVILLAALAAVAFVVTA